MPAMECEEGILEEGREGGGWRCGQRGGGLDMLTRSRGLAVFPPMAGAPITCSRDKICDRGIENAE